MKTILIILFCFFIVQEIFSQVVNNNVQYEVKYIFTQPLNNEVKVDDSLELVTIDRNGQESKVKIPSNYTSSPLASNIELDISVTATDKTATLTFQNSSAQSSEKKLVFESGKWHSVTNDLVKEIPYANTNTRETNDYKTIAGYQCRKYLVHDLTGDQDFEVWVSSKLPGTLMPGAGFRPFAGAVLEMYFPSTKARFVARQVNRIN